MRECKDEAAPVADFLAVVTEVQAAQRAVIVRGPSHFHLVWRGGRGKAHLACFMELAVAPRSTLMTKN